MEVRDPQTFAIIGAAMEVHRELGCGFLEAVYQDALAADMILRGIPFNREHAIKVTYKGVPLSATYRADFFCFDRVIVELKALDNLGTVEECQLLNYLKAAGSPVGLLLNFGGKSLESKRMVGPANFEQKSVASVKSVD